MFPVNIIIVFLTTEIISFDVLFGHHYVVGCLGIVVSPAALDYHKSLPNSHLHHPNLHRDNISLYFVCFPVWFPLHIS